LYLINQYNIDMFITPITKILQECMLVVTAVTIVMSISAVAMMMIPQTAAYATEDGDCDDEEHCEEGECETHEFEGKERKHCDY
jgi:hypothetical protein